MAAQIERKTTIKLNSTSINVGELRKILQEFDSNAILIFDYHKGYDQRDRDYIHLVVNHPAPLTTNYDVSQPIYPPGTR